MVSRGGRSKGCSNCRKRRVRCDETRPVCIRCTKRGLICDGPKESTWINQNHIFPSAKKNDMQIATTNPPAELSFAAFEDDICLAYTRKILLRGGPVELACDMIQNNGRPNFDDLPVEPGPGIDLLRDAVLSLAVTFFGSQHRQPKVTKRGYQQYGTVLRQLNRHLTIPELSTRTETVLTAVTCMLLEVFLPTGPNNFLKHGRGIEAILEARGPPVNPSDRTHMIFHNLRILSIIGSLAESKPSIFSRDEWKALPPYPKDEAGLLRHEIFDILADCTVIMGERDKLLASNGGPASHQPLLGELKTQLNKLKTLYPVWERYNEENLDDTATDMAKDIRIANHQSATVFMLYNTVYMCILQIVDSLAPSAKNASLRNAAAVKIVRCLELKQYEKREGAPESNTVGFVAIKIAWQALGGFNSPEGRRLARVVKGAVNGVYAANSWEALDSKNHVSWNHQLPIMKTNPQHPPSEKDQVQIINTENKNNQTASEQVFHQPSQIVGELKDIAKNTEL